MDMEPAGRSNASSSWRADRRRCCNRGRKDALTLNQLGGAPLVVSMERERQVEAGVFEQLRGLTVVVFMDNDDIGRAYGAETAAATVCGRKSGCLTCPGCGRVCQNTQTLAIW